MANTASAEKAMRQNVRRRARNRIVRSSARTQTKQAIAAIASNDKPAAESSVREAIRALDKAAQKGVIKKNTAARLKSRLLKRLNKLSTAPA